MPTERSFAELLRSYRGVADLTQEQLAARADLSVSAISLLERGARSAPRASTVARLAVALELDSSAHRDLEWAAQRRPHVPPGTISVLDDSRFALPSIFSATEPEQLCDAI
jgi:transcriptional regulator with XRE-family HTH domain